MRRGGGGRRKEEEAEEAAAAQTLKFIPASAPQGLFPVILFVMILQIYIIMYKYINKYM